MNRGFTLIEAIIYLGLFALLIGGAVLAAYDVFESSGRGATHAILQEEGEFVLAKVAWTLSGARAIAAPTIASGSCSASSPTLAAVKWDPALGTVEVTQTSSNATISRDGGAAVPINSSSVSISSLSFTHCWAGGANPDSIATRFTLTMRTPNGMVISQDFSNTDYVRR
jgi:Tfp pilus assembly protein PilE